MKRTRRGLALLLAVLLCLPLCGCRELDAMRQNQAFWQEDGSILWGETVYRPLPASDDLCPSFSYDNAYAPLCVTEPDVPVLLSNMMGETFSVSDDGVFLQGYYTDVQYCRADQYEGILTRIREGFTPAKLSYLYTAYDPEEETYYDTYYDLTPEQVAAVETVFTTVTPETVQDGFSFESEECIYVYAVSADNLFRRFALCVARAGASYYVTEDDSYTANLLYPVPEEMKPVFSAIMAANRQVYEARNSVVVC